MNDLLVYNIGCLATPTGKAARRGKTQGEILYRYNCCVLIREGVIEDIFDFDENAGYEKFSGVNTLDAQGRLVTPGLIDCHTHLVFGGWRHREFSLKLAGAGYLEILEKGGGILSTVEHTRSADFCDLLDKGMKLLDECLSYGVTTLEAKSGYGLDLENELKSLNVINSLNLEHNIDLVPTFMGAHALPKEYADNREGYVNELCNSMIPEVARTGLAEYCDVFCEKSAFSLEESKKILDIAKANGMKTKIHAEEINNLGGAVLAAEMGCESAEHLIKIDEAGINALASSETVAVCLPCTSFYLNEGFAPAKDIINAGGAVAFATDFNPGSSPNLNLQLAMSFACCKYRVSPEEALTGVTLNAAAAVGRQESIGSVEAGKKGDLIIWDADELSYLFYRFGSNLVKTVIKNGNVVFDK